MKLLNAYAPNNRASKHIKQRKIELKGEIDKYTTIVEVSSLSTINIEQLDRNQ